MLASNAKSMRQSKKNCFCRLVLFFEKKNVRARCSAFAHNRSRQIIFIIYYSLLMICCACAMCGENSWASVGTYRTYLENVPTACVEIRWMSKITRAGSSRIVNNRFSEYRVGENNNNNNVFYLCILVYCIYIVNLIFRIKSCGLKIF